MGTQEQEMERVLEGMSPDVALLMRNMMQTTALTWPQARNFRDDIVRLNGPHLTAPEQSAMAFAFLALMDRAEQLGLVADESLEQLRALRIADYRMILNVQAMVGDLIDPIKLEVVTRREVEAGRLSADDEFRHFAIKSAREFGGSPQPPKKKGWLQRLLGT